MKLSKFFLLCAGALLIIGCNETKKSEHEADGELQVSASAEKRNELSSAIIKGMLRNAENQEIRIDQLLPNAVEPLDTIQMKNGEFQYTLSIGEGGFYRVSINQQQAAIIIVKPGEEIVIHGDAADFEKSYVVTGSEESKRLRTLNHYITSIMNVADSLNTETRKHQEAKDISNISLAMKHGEALSQSMNQFTKRFIDDAPGSLASLAAVKSLDRNIDFEYYQKILAGLKNSYPTSSYTANFSAMMRQLTKLSVGAVAPDLNLPLPNGDYMMLSSLRGKVVLIDFWASWCKPCRQENPNVVRLYNEYHKKGFEIYGVSLDANKESWEAAIEQDGLAWHHVSDLKRWQSSVVKIYSVEGIPMTVLIDEDGKIIAKNLRGEALERKLAELFNS